MLAKFSKIYHTLIYLKPIQIYFQVWYRLRKKLFGEVSVSKAYKNIQFINWENHVNSNASFSPENQFNFLNISHQFKNNIDWNFSDYGKLWTYNLNYFEFLNQKNISKENGLSLIRDYVNNDATLKDGKEPYPISLRGINWIKFLSYYVVEDNRINKTLFEHYHILAKKLEYHLLGNHLLENGFSLLFGAYYFKDDVLYKKAYKILKNELKEQILNDGAHFELSPMYHRIIFLRLLDVIQLTQINSWKADDLHQYLITKAGQMLSWLHAMTYKNGAMPMFNDCANDVAPQYNVLVNYAKALNIKSDDLELSDSGYRKIEKNSFELFLDIGDILPSYQPSHNHADTFNFELAYNSMPIIVDVGTSTYKKNALRHKERSTISHNTVTINSSNSSEVWGGFRVAKRAKVTILEDEANKIRAHHNGFQKKYGVNHQRTFNFVNENLLIKDEINHNKAEARFHFHPNITPSVSKNLVSISSENMTIQFDSETLAIVVKDYDFCAGFNKTIKAKVLVVSFFNQLITTIMASNASKL